MGTRQSFTEPSQEQWDEVDRLEHRYFEKFGVRPKRPEFITHEQPTMASVGKYLGDLREMLGKSRSSKRHFSPREQEVNLKEALVKRWADLYQQVHGPCAVMAAPEDVEDAIKKLREELVTISHKKILMERIDSYREQLGKPDLEYRKQDPRTENMDTLIALARELHRYVRCNGVRSQNTRAGQASGQLSFFAELDGKRVDITEDVHRFIASKESEIRECADGTVRCPRCGSETLSPMEMIHSGTLAVTPIFHCPRCGRMFDKEGNFCG